MSGKEIAYAAAAGCGLAFAIFAIALATGQTFGQRCEKAHPTDMAAVNDCVDRLAGFNQ